MPTVLIVPEMMRNVPAPYVDLLRGAGFEVRYPLDPQLPRGKNSEEALIAELSVADATIASTETYTPAVLAALPRLRVIARSGVGYDRVDVPAATERQVVVTITPGANHGAVAELALGLLFAVTKRIVTNDHSVRRGEWPRFPLRPVRGQTLGIVGLGRIGRSLARRAVALEMQVVTHETHPDIDFIEKTGIELVDFDTLLARSDFVSIHCPLNTETTGLFNAEVFAKMKPGSVLINTSRGPLVDEDALVDALDNGPVAAAALDVFAVEPPDTSHPLFARDDVVVSPHMGGVDEESLVAMGIEAANSIVQLYRGEWPEENVVNRELAPGWSWD